ncbi:MAG: ATP-binding protein [Candidatus Heimdallarchaeaceae archaeon]
MKIYRDDIEYSGRLMRVSTEGYERCFDVWFDYTKELMNEIKDGDLISVDTFYYNKENKEVRKEAILRLSNLLPIHYAMPQDLTGYPAFVSESVSSASLDWDEQISESIEDITKIVGRAYLIGQNILLNPDKENKLPEINSDFSFPKVGDTIKLLSNEMSNYIYNLALEDAEDKQILGTLIRDDKIKINFSTEDFIKMHFGIFGFTGVGKSNATAHIIKKLLLESKKDIVVILYDLLDEYLATMIDLLLNDNILSYYINIEVSNMPDHVYQYINSDKKDEELLELASKTLLKTLTIPSSMKKSRFLYEKPIKNLLKSNKIRVYAPDYFISGSTFWRKYCSDLKTPGMSPQNKELIDDLGTRFFNIGDNYLSIGDIENLIKYIQSLQERTSKAVKDRFDFVIKKLNSIKHNLEDQNQPKDLIRFTPSDTAQLISGIQANKLLIIINSRKPEEIRGFAYDLSMKLYEDRRMGGIIEPLCLSVFDEADEFIPSISDSHSKELSTKAVETLARRGRKYGLGVGLATQRVSLLNTSIMAQPHTYLISKLPRVEDQRRITDAFALSKDIFSETVLFQKGQWLAISYDALGLEGVPIPIQIKNNEDSVREYLNKVEK